MRCSNCGTENKEGVKFCKKCGNSMYPAVENYDNQYQDDYQGTVYDYSDKNVEVENKKLSKKWLRVILIIFVILIIAAVAVYFTVFEGYVENIPFIGENASETTQVVETTVSLTTQGTTTAPTTMVTPTTQTLPQAVVPDIAGLSVDDATKKLSEIGLKYDLIYTQSQSIQKDYVISQSPISGRNVNENETVTIYVSKGYDIQNTTVNPDNYGAVLPQFSSITASSTLASEGKFSYEVDNLRYNDDTCWCEGVKGTGNGEYVMFSSNTLQSVSGINIVNGYAKDNTVYYNNSRVKKMEFEFSDGTTLKKSVSDTPNLQDISFGKTINTAYIKIKIVDTYTGKAYDDTCVSFISPY